MINRVYKIRYLIMKNSKNPYVLFNKLLNKTLKIEDLYETEKIIATNADCSLSYAIYLNKRFVEGEKEIVKYSKNSLYYSLYVLKKRFREAETVIGKDPLSLVIYTSTILKTNCLKLNKILNVKNDFIIKNIKNDYFISNLIFYLCIVSKRLIQLEQLLNNKIYITEYYLNKIVKFDHE